MRNSSNKMAYWYLIQCPYHQRFAAMNSVNDCGTHIQTMEDAMKLPGVGVLMALVMLQKCDTGCRIRGHHYVGWCRCIT